MSACCSTHRRNLTNQTQQPPAQFEKCLRMYAVTKWADSTKFRQTMRIWQKWQIWWNFAKIVKSRNTLVPYVLKHLRTERGRFMLLLNECRPLAKFHQWNFPFSPKLPISQQYAFLDMGDKILIPCDCKSRRDIMVSLLDLQSQGWCSLERRSAELHVLITDINNECKYFIRGSKHRESSTDARLDATY